MAWTSLTYAFGSLLTSTKMTQLYDNLTALANGDSGAPTIQPSAISTYAPGSYFCFVHTAPGSRSSSGYDKMSEFKTALSGNLSVGFLRRTNGVGNTASTRIYVNSMAVSSGYSDASSAWTFVSRNITSCNAGDLIQIFGKYDGGVATIYTKNFGILSDNAYLTGAGLASDHID